MTGISILSRFWAWERQFLAFFLSSAQRWNDLHANWLHPERLPRYAAETPVAQRTLELLGPLDWPHFPERNLLRHWCQPAVSYAAFAGACWSSSTKGWTRWVTCGNT